MKKKSKTLSGIAKTEVSRSYGRVVASSQWYSTIPSSKDQDLEEEEEEEHDEDEGSLKKEEDEDEGSLKKMQFIPFPKGYIGGGGFLVKKKEETDKSTGTESSSSSAKGTDMNYNYGTNGGKSYDKRTTSNSDQDGQGTEIPEYGGCSGCPGCSGGCRYCFGCDGCQYKF
ncbi:PREDICTED: uncharacterized protein LOC104761581 [Camelina sativa]|uniref:Uncharacterized protein LOC104761581 n=1 Tax=Camelina sativa TaxID=90675 RepID=A0ABM0XAA3_CAMSA|nr:PREDICTED: uncharacterized protein LOC104761581 [Camelina sativa]